MESFNLFGKTQQELTIIAEKLMLPSYTGNQICDWLYKKNVDSIDRMSNLSKQTRQLLSAHYVLHKTHPVQVQVSADGTLKYLFGTGRQYAIETVLIPDKNRNTLCISCQVGCKMNCMFCMTGKQGFQGNLSTSEILNQVVSLPERPALSSVVFMGMGEPMDNVDNVLTCTRILTSSYGYGWSPSRITISTIGVIPGLKKVIEESNCPIAISMHTPFGDERKKLMPIEQRYGIDQVVDLLKSSQINRQRRISFEYIMFKQLNDTPRHINGITRLLNGLKCRINLIRYHEIPGVDLRPSSEETIRDFKNRLNAKGILTTIRASRGQDIYAACGLLSTAFKQPVTSGENAGNPELPGSLNTGKPIE